METAVTISYGFDSPDSLPLTVQHNSHQFQGNVMTDMPKYLLPPNNHFLSTLIRRPSTLTCVLIKCIQPQYWWWWSSPDPSRPHTFPPPCPARLCLPPVLLGPKQSFDSNMQFSSTFRFECAIMFHTTESLSGVKVD